MEWPVTPRPGQVEVAEELARLIEQGARVRARRRRVKVIFITQGPLPPAELRSSFEILLFDCDWEMRRSLRAPTPDSQLGVGECWWVRRSGAPKKLKFKVGQ